MHHPPGFWLFEHVYYGITETLFLIFTFLTLMVVRRSPQKEHLSWLIPSFVCAVFAFLYRLLRNTHYAFGIGNGATFDSLEWIFIFTAEFFGICSTIILWRTMRQLSHQPAAPAVSVSHPAQPGVWPPPPTVRQD